MQEIEKFLLLAKVMPSLKVMWSEAFIPEVLKS